MVRYCISDSMWDIGISYKFPYRQSLYSKIPAVYSNSRPDWSLVLDLNCCFVLPWPRNKSKPCWPHQVPKNHTVRLFYFWIRGSNYLMNWMSSIYLSRNHSAVGTTLSHKCVLPIVKGAFGTLWTVIAQLSISHFNVTKLISETRLLAESHLHSAQELSLLRHSLADELSYLSEELASSMSEAESGPTLLEDIETLHRSLKEMESVKSYLQVVEHALKLRFVSWYIVSRVLRENYTAANRQFNKYVPLHLS
jgi:hypothetical protein